MTSIQTTKITAQFLIYFALAYAVKRISVNPALISLIWYANAWAIAVLVTARMRRWLPMTAVFALMSLGANLAGGTDIKRSLIFTGMNALQIVMAAGIIHRLNVWDSLEVSVKNLVRMLIFGIILPPAVLAPIAGFILGHGNFDLTATIRWFVGAALGGMAVYPTYASIRKTAIQGQLRQSLSWKTLLCLVFAITFTASIMVALKGPFSYIALMLAVMAMLLSFTGLSIVTTASIVTAGLMISRGWHTLLPVENEWLELPRLLIIGIVTVPAMLISVYVNANAEQAREILNRKQELEDELEQRRLLFENSSDPIVLLDTQLNAVLINSRMAYLLKLQKGTRSLQEFARFLVTVDEAGLQERLNSSTGGRVNFETMMQDTEGGKFPVEVTSAGSMWQGERVWMMACRDITERRNTEIHIQGLLEFNQRIVETSPAGVLIYNEQGQCILANTSATRVTGQPQVELLLHNYRDETSWAGPDIHTMATKAIATGQTLNGIVHTHTHNGNDLWMDCYFKRFEEAGQQRLLLLISDNTARVKAQAELEQTRHDLQNILDALPSLIAYWDSNEINRFTNLSCQRWLGLPQSEITGKSLQQIMTEEGYATFRPRVDAVLKGQEQLFERHVLDPQTQAERFMMMHLLPDYHQNTIRGFYVLTHDITMAKQAEAQLLVTLDEVKAAQTAAEEASRAKSEFVANMSHEIRTPMNAVLGLTQLLRETPLNGLQRDYVDKVLSSSKALLQVLNDILDFAKMEAGRLVLETIPFHLEDVLENVSNLFAVTAANRGVELFIDLDPSLDDIVVGDPLRTGQVLNNLVGNAVKFTEKGQICIRVEAVEESTEEYLLKYSVRDSGIGIAPDKLAGLFEAFSQADTSTTRKYGGSGLGLTISKNLVELMGGQIEAQSTLKEGSTFTFTARMKRAKEGVRQKRVPQILGARTLIVDDNCVSCDILSTILTRWGLLVECANSGARAIEMICQSSEKANPYEFIMVDWRMPEMDGLEVTVQLKKLATEGKLASMPMVIMVTEADRHELAAVAGPAFEHPILTKPVTPSRLFDTIANLSENPASTLVQEPERHKNNAAEVRLRLRGMHVLLVEDNEVNRQVAGAILQGMGIDVDMAEDGSIAVDMITKRSYDAVLMDLQMPVMDGFEATQHIRARSEYATLPIIAMTAAAFSDDRKATMAAGMNAHVAKPIDVDELVKALLPYALPHSLKDDQNNPLKHDMIPDKTTRRQAILKEAGINVAQGLARLGQDLDLLYRLVKVFASSTRDLPAQLTAAIEGKDRAEAVRLVHSLKGSSGNIAADNIYQMAIDLEHDLTKGEHSNVVTLISELTHLQKTVLALEDDEDQKSVPQELSHSDIINLESLLARQFVIPDEMIAKLNGLSNHLVIGSSVKRLLQLLDNYDYANARRILDIIIKELEVGE